MGFGYSDTDPNLIELQERGGGGQIHITPVMVTNAVASLNGQIGALNIVGSGLVIVSAGAGTITIAVSSPLGIANGGTGSTTAAGARGNLGAAAAGANSDITALTGITGSIIGNGNAIQWGRAAITMPDADYAVLSAEYQRRILELSGTLTASRNVSLPATDGAEWVVNNKTGQTLTVKTSGGSGVAIAAGKTAIVYGDGTNIVRATPDA